MEENKRSLFWDNFKGILIVFVVLGHLLENFFEVPKLKDIYLFIYLFHMPLFVFVSGFFSQKCNYKKIKNEYIYVYIVARNILFFVLVSEGRR